MSNTDSEIFEFKPANLNAVARVSPEADLGTSDEKEFGDLVCGGYIGRVSKSIIPRFLDNEMRDLGLDPKGLAEKQSLVTMMVPHTFSLRPSSDFLPSHISSVGCLIKFLPGNNTFSIVDLLPNPSFRKVFESSVTGQVEIGYSWLLNVFGLAESLGDLVNNENNSLFKFNLDFSHAFFATDVSATGTETNVASFELYSGKDKPLSNQDITVWTIVALNRYASELNFQLKFFYTSRKFLIPSRCETDWMDYKYSKSTGVIERSDSLIGGV